VWHLSWQALEPRDKNPLSLKALPKKNPGLLGSRAGIFLDDSLERSSP
jgi:hypothetical protein